MPSDAVAPTAPADPATGVRLYWSFALLGCGLMTPWNAILSAIDYFNDVYPDYNSLRWISVVYMPGFLLGLAGSSLTPAKNRGQNRIAASFLFITAALTSIAIIELALIRHDRGTGLSFALLLSCIAVLSASHGVAEGCFVGFTIYLTQQYSQAYLIGIGFSEIVAVSLRALAKASLTDSTEGLRISACIFFFLASALGFACFLVHRFVILADPLIQTQQTTDSEQPLVQTNAQQDKTSRVTLRDILNVAYRMRLAHLNILLNTIVTLTIFPGVPSDVKSDALGDWYGVMLVAIFSVSDFTVRLIPAHRLPTDPRQVTALNVARISMIPITFITVQTFSNPVSISILILVLGFSNGYMFRRCFAMSQEKMHGKDESFIGGSTLVAVKMTGFCLGSILSLLWSAID